MAKYRIDSIAALARQMAFTPSRAREAQLDAAEALLHSINPAKAYPYDFVVFRITGYHPKDAGQDLLTGLALQHDLGLLIEQVSETLDVSTAALTEPALSIDDLTERFNVTSKTIQRWRRRGLPARRFVFGDGKRRVGFLLSSVEQFFATHREQVVRGTNFSQVSEQERDEIIRRARRLATGCRCCVNEISRRIASRLDRSPMTILHTVRKHDEDHPESAVFPAATEEMSEAEQARILKLYRRGVSIAKLARRSCRTRSSIYRLVVEERIARLNRRKVRFIDDPLYHIDDAAAAVDAIAEPSPLAEPAPQGEAARVPRDLPPYLAELYRTPLLSPARERALFLKFNFRKMQFVTARRRLDPQFARTRDLDALETLWRRVVETKNEIVRANLRLVVSIARRHLRTGLSLMELISDGNLTLLRAVESFDTHRGNRFSTYATLALMKGFARSVPQMLGKRAAGVATDQRMLEVPDRYPSIATQRFIDRESVHDMLQQLDDRERRVLHAYYGLDQTAPATYEQVGQRLGLSKQRVRQIEQTALAKLRTSAEL